MNRTFLDRLPEQFMIWFVVCGIAAAPSFLWGFVVGGTSAPAVLGMFAGIGLYVLAYTIVASTDEAESLRRDPHIARTLRIGYGVRVAQSLAFCLPGISLIDTTCGRFSLAVASTLLGSPQRSWEELSDLSPTSLFVHHLLATTIQGVVLNVILFALMGVIYGVLRATWQPKAHDPNLCSTCGYDLRASGDRCPECGTVRCVIVPNPSDPIARQLTRL